MDLPERLARLRENVDRANCPADIVAGSLLHPESWWDQQAFDRILLDVPCTGTGVMRRHPDIKLRRQAENALQFAAQQLSLLEKAWFILKPGGKLLYTTCSIFPEENHVCIKKFLAMHPQAKSIKLPSSLGIDSGYGHQRLPGIHAGDGFFYALLQKGK